jgi:hypothetical protein
LGDGLHFCIHRFNHYQSCFCRLVGYDCSPGVGSDFKLNGILEFPGMA